MLFLYNELKNILLKYTYSPTTNALQKLPLEKKNITDCTKCSQIVLPQLFN